VRDALAEKRFCGKLFVEMDRVKIAGKLGEFSHDFIGDLFARGEFISDFYIHNFYPIIKKRAANNLMFSRPFYIF
jgi:hypothetical protein